MKVLSNLLLVVLLACVFSLAAKSAPQGFLSDQGIMDQSGFVQRKVSGIRLDQAILNCWMSYTGELWSPSECDVHEDDDGITVIVGRDPEGTAGQHWRITISY